MTLTLPNPSINFVPLDVLTAEELNEVVANINTIADAFPISAANIANGSITSAKIGNSAVNASAINWSNFPVEYSQNNPATPTSLSTTAKSLISINLASFPVGSRILALGSVYIESGDGSNDVGSYIKSGSTTGVETIDFGLYGKTQNPILMFTKASGVSTVNLYSRIVSNYGGKEISASAYSLVAFRVG